MLAYYGLFALQHRGQESAGIVTAEPEEKTFHTHKGMGLVSQVFKPRDLEKLKGSRAIGHVRYSTTGSSTLKNAQPFVVDTARGQLAIAHRVGQGQTQRGLLLAQALAQPLVLAHGKPMPGWELLDMGGGVINVHGQRLSRFEADLGPPL